MDTSSIGPTWPPRGSSYGRIKGIDTRGVVRSHAHLREIISILAGFAARTDSPHPSAAPDRISIRFVATGEILAEGRHDLAVFGEALIPLQGGLFLVYCGWNGRFRRPHLQDVRRSLANLQTAENRNPLRSAEVFSRATDQVFAIELPSLERRHDDLDLRRAISELYERFGWGPAESGAILAEPNNVLAVARDRDLVVSAGIAEMSRLDFEDGLTLRIAEFSEAATRQSHQKRGLYSAICATLMRELARRSSANSFFGGNIDLAFGECNGLNTGVLVAARRLGRTFARSLRDDLPLRLRGYLPQHAPIAGVPRRTPYNDLFPSFIRAAELDRFWRES